MWVLDAKGDLSGIEGVDTVEAHVTEATKGLPPEQAAVMKQIAAEQALVAASKEQLHALGDVWDDAGAIGPRKEWSGEQMAPVPGLSEPIPLAVTLSDAGEIPCSDAEGAPECRKLVGTSIPDADALKEMPAGAAVPPLVQEMEVWVEKGTLRPWRAHRVTRAASEGGQRLERTWTWDWKR